jgi:Protein of unknown function (DUF2637)
VTQTLQPTAQPAAAGRAVIIIAAAVVAPLLCMLAVLGGIGSFATVRDLAEPWFGHLAWIVPVGIDLGILALLAWDLLAEYLAMPWPVLRWTAWVFIAVTVYLNIAAAHGNLDAAVMHAAMPVLFITVIEGIRHLIRQRAGLTAGTRIEPIPVSRWLLAPRSTAILARRMILWHVTSYRDGLRLESERLAAVSRLQEQHGRWLWRWRAPLGDRLSLRLAPTAAVTSATPPLAEITSGSRNAQPDMQAWDGDKLGDRDVRLVDTAADILRDADEHGVRLSQMALARRLRALGMPIPNQRLRWLAAAARARVSVPPELDSRIAHGGLA